MKKVFTRGEDDNYSVVTSKPGNDKPQAESTVTKSTSKRKPATKQSKAGE